MRIFVDISRFENAIGKFFKVLEDGSYLRILANQIFFNRLRRLDEGKEYTGNPLPDLKPQTWLQKKNPQILIETQSMYDSIVLETDQFYGVTFDDPAMMERMCFAIYGDTNRVERDAFSIGYDDLEWVPKALDLAMKEA